ncbi:MAG: hypothetical protein V1767_01025 [Chloroflexota bacterium]
MIRIYLALVSWIGAVLWAIAGFWASKEAWSWRKFGATVIRALFAAVIWAISYNLSEASEIVYLAALTSGIAFDVGINRIAGAAGNGSWPLPGETLPPSPSSLDSDSTTNTKP